jgi:hypothetical protein
LAIAEGVDSLHSGVEYRGASGVTQRCVEAVANFLQEQRTAGLALLLSSPKDKYGCRSHGFLLLIDDSPEVIVADGFASGYGGTGPHGLSTAICLLDACRWDINEVFLGRNLFEKVCAGLASWEDINRIKKRRRRPASYVFDYVDEDLIRKDAMHSKWVHQKVNLPLSLFDSRLLDIAIGFWRDPDAQLTKAYRRLEDSVRKRCRLSGSKEYGAKLFSRAFGHDKSPLTWRLNEEDTTCYAPLFAGTFAGFRNARAHRDPGMESDYELAMELLQLNTLFVLESRLVERSTSDAADETNDL